MTGWGPPTRGDAIGAAACVLASVLVVLVGVVPVRSARARAEEEQARVSEARRQAEEASSARRLAERELAELQLSASDTPTLRPADQVNRRLAELNELAAACNLSVHEVKPGEARDAGRYRTVPIRLAGVGPYPDVAEFLRRLRVEHRDLGVPEFRLVSLENAEGTTGAFVFNLAWYAAPEGRDGGRAP